MSRSKHAVELYALLVDETYGELTSRIFTILLRRGRLPVQMLTKHTRLTPRHVRHGLAVLIQQNLAYFHFDRDTSTTYYEANQDAAYGLVRSGKIMELVESRFGSLAKDLVQVLFQVGHTKVSELIATYEMLHLKHNEGTGLNADTNGVNGVNGHEKLEQTSGHLHAVLIELLQAGMIEPVKAHMFRSPTDSYAMIEREILLSDYDGNTKGNKQKDELKGKVRERLQGLREEGREWNAKGGKKRSHAADITNGVNGTGKRRRLSNGAVNGDHYVEDDGARLDLNLTLKINYEKCTVALRNQRLVQLANERIGETTALVYAELLRLLEGKIPRCRPDPNIDYVDEDTEGPGVTTMEVTASLSRTIDVGHGIGKITSGSLEPREAGNPARSKTQQLEEAEVEGNVSEDEGEHDAGVTRNTKISGLEQDEPTRGDSLVESSSIKSTKRPRVTFQETEPENYGDRQSRTSQVKMHLQLLANDSCRLLKKGDDRGQGEFHVNYETIVANLRETELDQMILENFGKNGHRLARMMRKLGKLEEKQLPNVAFMKQKDVRTKLAEMHMAGVVDIQEVPRDAGRTTARTMFLWYFDTERVSTILLDSLYKCMTRCFQRLDIEKRRVNEILVALQREDTQGKTPEEALEPEPLNRLRVYQNKEELLLTQIGRLDELIGTFRDF